MKIPITIGDFRFSVGSDMFTCSAAGQDGQAFLETVMTVGFLVAIAIAINKMLSPVVVKSFENIAQALSSVGP